MRHWTMASTLYLCLMTSALAAEQPTGQSSHTNMAAGDGPTFVAGSTPSARPANAPSLLAVARDAGWYDKALSGVAAPYPQSLKFLADQGNWYTPFTEPGMTGPYDIRHRHR